MQYANNTIQLKNLFSMVLFYSFLVGMLCLHISCKQEPSLDTHLAQLKDYDYGQSREILTEVDGNIQNTLKSKENLSSLEQKLDRFLESDASLASKQFICRQLALIGSEKSLPVLSELIADSATFEMARYALEKIPDTKVDDLLRKTLENSSGTQRLALINTVGLRRDSKAVPLLEKMMSDPDVPAASAAVSALGAIADDASIHILKNAFQVPATPLHRDIMAAYLSCAERLQTKGDLDKAYTIFNEIYEKADNNYFRSGALRGMLFCDRENAGDQIAAILLSSDIPMQSAAIQTLILMPEINNIAQIAEMLPRLSPPVQVQLMAALGDFRNPSIPKTAVGLLKSKIQVVRIAAIRSLAKTGGQDIIDDLAAIAAAGNADEQTAAREGLYLLQGAGVDQAFVSGLSTSEKPIQIELIYAIRERQINSARDIIISYTEHSDNDTRLAAIQCLATIGIPENLPGFITELLNSESDKTASAWEQTIVDIARRIPENEQPAQFILEKYRTLEQPAGKSTLIRVMGKLRDPSSLPLILNELKSGQADIQYACIQALNNWQADSFNDDQILNELLRLNQSYDDARKATLTLRAYLYLTAIVGRNNPDHALKYYKESAKYVKQIAEKRMLLSGLQAIKSIESFQMAAGYVEDSEIWLEAESTIINLAPALLTRYRDEVKTNLERIIKKSTNAQHIEEAKEILNK